MMLIRMARPDDLDALVALARERIFYAAPVGGHTGRFKHWRHGARYRRP